MQKDDTGIVVSAIKGRKEWIKNEVKSLFAQW